MKNTDIKNSMYNWLIAIVLAIVVAGVTLCACLMPSLLPIASADISSVTTGIDYIIDFASTDNFYNDMSTNYTVNSDLVSGSIYYNGYLISISSYNSFSRAGIAYNTVSDSAMGNPDCYITFYYGTSLNTVVLGYKNGVLSGVFFRNGTVCSAPGFTTGKFLASNVNFELTLNFATYSNFDVYFNSWCLNDLISSVIDNTPLLDSEPIAFDIDFWFNQVEGYPLAQLTHYSQRVCAFEILNAYDYESIYDSYTGVDINVEVIYQRGIDTLSYSYHNVIRPDYYGKYYLALYPFQSEPLPSTYFISGFRVSFYGYDDYIQIDNLHNQYVWLNFVQSYWSTIDSGIGDVGFDRGYISGYNAGSNDNNNLYSLAWATLNFPFRIMFGSYDNNAYLENGDPNPNYHQYVGGLFNFSILGVDFRAFILGISSMCVVVAIIKLVLGTRGSSNG